MAQNRMRGVQIITRVTEKEKGLIRERMKLLSTDNMSAYIRKMAIDGYIINMDYSEIKNHAAQLNKIGVNINQLVKHMHQSENLHAEDIAEVKRLLHEIWLSERQLIRKIT
jgi:predicted transcriptional regulator